MLLVEQLLSGQRRALARTISHIENNDPDAHALLSALYGLTGRAHVVGITGAPGTGKSTLVSALARAYRAAGMTVGVVAVDPTSPFSGGALLGDRVRMRDLSGDPGIFIRSMATRGSLGGLARATADVISVLDAAGFDRVLVETVGVGQAEVDIASAAHTTVVVEAPGLGDEVQAIKAGVLEVADVFAVNKADREGADHTVMALQMMQGLAPPTTRGSAEPTGNRETPVQEDADLHHPRQTNRSAPHGLSEPGHQENGSWLPPIVKTIAVRGEGIEALRDWIEQHRTYLQDTGQFGRREVARAAAALEHILADRLLEMLRAGLPVGRMAEVIQQVAQRGVDPYTAADDLLTSLLRPREASPWTAENLEEN